MRASPNLIADSAVLYTRVTTEEQEDEGLSLEAQVAECRRYAADHGLVILGEFQDVMSGTRNDRPDFQRMLADVRRLCATDGRAVAVVVSALDRLGRKLLEGLQCRSDLAALGVAVHVVDHHGEIDDDTASDLLLEAQKEISRLRRRVTKAWSRARERGWLKTTSASWGYRWRARTDPERKQGAPNSVLDIDTLAAPFASDVFERVAQGQSAVSVSLWMAGLPQDVRGGRPLAWAAVHRMLRSPVYIGRLPIGSADGKRPPSAEVLERPVGRWPALVTDQTWLQVQDRLDCHRQPRKTAKSYVLTGWLVCPVDRTRMHGGGQGAKWNRRYRCDAVLDRVGEKVRCGQTALAAPVEGQVLAEAARLVDSVTNDSRVHDALELAWDRLEKPRDEPETEAGKRRKQLRQTLDKLQRRRTVFAERFADGDIDKAEYADAIQKNRHEVASIEADVQALDQAAPVEPKLPPFDQVLSMVGSWAGALAAADVQAQRDMLALLIERVEAVRLFHAGRRSEWGVRVDWTPLGEALRSAALGLEKAAA